MHSSISDLVYAIVLVALMFVLVFVITEWGKTFPNGPGGTMLFLTTVAIVFMTGLTIGEGLSEKRGYFLAGKSNLRKSTIYHRKARSISLPAQGFKPGPADIDEEKHWLTLIECPNWSTRYCLFESEPPEHFVILPGDSSFIPVFSESKDEEPISSAPSS